MEGFADAGRVLEHGLPGDPDRVQRATRLRLADVRGQPLRVGDEQQVRQLTSAGQDEIRRRPGGSLAPGSTSIVTTTRRTPAGIRVTTSTG